MKKKKLTDKELLALSRVHSAGLTPTLLEQAASACNVSPVVLQTFGIGYSPDYGRYTFPMFDGEKKLTGFVQWGGKLRDGKWNEKPGIIPGSRLGLFIPDPFEVVDCALIESPQLLILPQGPIDAAFCREVGFMGVIGRPVCAACAEDVATILQTNLPQEVVVMLPAGEGAPGYLAGAMGAMDLIELLVPLVPDKIAAVRCAAPLAGRTFRQSCVDFPTLTAHVLAAKTMTPSRVDAGRQKLRELGRKAA